MEATCLYLQAVDEGRADACMRERAAMCRHECERRGIAFLVYRDAREYGQPGAAMSPTRLTQYCLWEVQNCADQVARTRHPDLIRSSR